MSDSIRNSRDTLPLAAERRIDRVCLEFEKACQSGAQPQIERHLAAMSGPERTRLLQELLLLELDYRGRAGQRPTAEEYHGRFPQDTRLIEEVFGTSTGRCDDPAPGTRIRYFGDYQLLEEIARGGMGIVYKARQLSLNRVVALKLVLTGQFASEEEVQRFLLEAEAAANLQHPNIVAIYEVGKHDGQHYFSMAHIEGRSLAEMIRENPLPGEQAAGYVETVAQAVEYAHQRGTLHRDLKPSNILIDRDNQPWITDFGLAKRVEANSDLTRSGQILGSPSYMPPEQASGEHGEVGPASDVYALGAVLYDLVTGRPPFKAETPTDTLLQAMHSEPVPPRELNPSVPRDLETICLKCLEKDPRKRYRTSRELAEELRRYLRGEPIQARPITRLGRTWRWCQRYPMAAVVVAIVALIAIVAPLVGLNQARLAANEAAAREDYRRQLYAAEMVVAQQAWEAANVGRVRQLLARHVPGPHQTDLRGFQWYHLWRLCKRGWTVPTLSGHQASIWSLAFSPDGKTLASGSLDGAVMMWDVPGRTLRGALTKESGPVLSLTFAPDGQTLASASTGANNHGCVKIWNVQQRELQRQLPWEKSITCVAISPDGKMLAWGSFDGTVSLCDYHTLKPEHIHTFTGRHALWVTSLAFSPDGQTLASGSVDYKINLWDVRTRKLRKQLPGHESWVRGLAISPDGALIASAGHDKTVKLWDLHTGELKKTLAGHRAYVWSVAFSPDSRTLVSSSSDGSVKLWDVVLGTEKDSLIGHENPTVLAVAYSPDGSTVASGGADAKIKLWDVTKTRSQDTLTGHSQAVKWVAISPDDKTLASASADTTIKLWDVAAGSLRSTLQGHTSWVNCVKFSHDGALLVSAGNDGMLKLWDASAGVELRPQLPGDGMSSIWSVAFSADDKMLASGDQHGIVTLWDVQTRRERGQFVGHDGIVWPVAFSPNGETLASGGWQDKTVRLWDVATGQSTILREHTGSVYSVAFSPDGMTLASGSEDTTVKLWDLATYRVRRTLRGHAGEVLSVAFSPDGQTLVSGSSDTTIKLWYLETDREPETLTGHQSAVTSVTFSRDGLVLASASEDTTVRLWRRATEEEVRSTAWQR